MLPVASASVAMGQSDAATISPTRSTRSKRGPGGGPHLAEHDEAIAILGRHRSEQQQVGERKVRQHAPHAEESLEVVEAEGVELGVTRRQLGRARHRSTLPFFTATACGLRPR